MNIAVCNVGFAGFRDPAWNAARRAVLSQLIEQAAAADCAALLLPGGFLTVTDEAAVAGVFDELVPALQGCGVAVVLGVDVAPAAGGWWPMDPAAAAALVSANHLPLFALAWTPAGVAGPWRQRSITAADTWQVLAQLNGAVRTVVVAGQRIGVLVCGEMFNSEIRAAYRASGVGIVVDCGHVGAGWRAFRGLEGLTAPPGIGEALACAHVSSYPGRQYRYSAGVPVGGSGWDLWVDGPPWASGVVFHL